MAEGNGGGRAGISAGQAIAQRGDLCLERSDTQVGDFYPKQYRRGTIKEFEQRIYEVLSIAKGSAAELETQLLLAVRIGYLSEAAISPTIELITEVVKIINTLHSKLTTNH